MRARTLTSVEARRRETLNPQHLLGPTEEDLRAIALRHKAEELSRDDAAVLLFDLILASNLNKSGRESWEQAYLCLTAWEAVL